MFVCLSVDYEPGKRVACFSEVIFQIWFSDDILNCLLSKLDLIDVLIAVIDERRSKDNERERFDLWYRFSLLQKFHLFSALFGFFFCAPWKVSRWVFSDDMMETLIGIVEVLSTKSACFPALKNTQLIKQLSNIIIQEDEISIIATCSITLANIETENTGGLITGGKDDPQTLIF